MVSVTQRRPAVAGGRTRDRGIDALRGVAVLLMLADHVALFEGHADAFRVTLGRVAMPVFFVVGGYLARRVTWRHGWCAGLGLVLGAVAPWSSVPNVLVWYAVGSVVLVFARRWGVSPSLLVVVGLTMGANGYGWHGPTFEPTALVGLMAVGATLGPDAWLWRAARHLPGAFARIGRYPLSIYAGHVLLLTALHAGGAW